MSPVTDTSRNSRWSVASRAVAAVLGGYAFSSAATVLMAVLWPAPLAQAVMWASMLSFAVYTAAVIWVFATRSALRAWAGMLVGAAVLCALAWAFKIGGGA
ncbi:DUF3649 domain-containing protein [Hydrogenophaga sp. BPS33]|uniref:DUF3649 domain-containing protein n=1 Tax=Hydrogenophaga sp. BPS33 TaxID=2651974 RepID=UPI00131F87C9|nr:DUF3649 domain-containing protein [Hydrogenophaga sp. BPS33]QHE83640.1 DUF3649 domain-containing protein [Hydrogenophaga sp. BPS33]